MKETAQRAALATLVAGGIVVARTRALAAEAARGAPLLRLHPRGGDAADGREARAARHPARRRDRAPLRRLHRADRRLPLAGGAAGDRPGRQRARRHPDDALRPRRAGAPVDRDQARHPRRPAAPARGPPLRRAARRPRRRGDADRVRGRARDLLRARERRLLDLRARPGRGPALLAAAAAEAEARARHVGADRREARRVRPRAGGADRARRESSCRSRSGRSGCRTGSWSERSPGSSRSSR